ncbi:Gfo/Idh/MocA family protein [Hoeflea prorocentri]|uniref:Gfo/Idh/MocA family oxidoreductase n=1 Tax=Hoeflea prorocentri TaxID=1922333 RepID=A0A9X3UIS1_9HYPH|nr:Gfo/Idh/MocA family oxidoreductase [Hoeflea prorocentri]MCY6381185.1 Gfo/Idh/MocA family oxidoreductase [Hoeflea prorocentri]MDA5398985.1 Gfo/Idh/MocA family oxidoreductase [Hoeflea prorocentri]
MAKHATGKTNIAPVRLGMVGGGQGAFIGAVHRIAARLDGHYDLVAGALSSDADRALASGLELGLAPDRCYRSFKDMAKIEAARDDGIEAVSIVTPNHVHYPAARAFLEAGIHVICDKPLSSSLADAKKLAKVAEKSDALFVLTHNYTGYPMIRQARRMIAEGRLGTIRVVQAEYAQDWLTEAEEDTGNKQAEWRTDPERSGVGGCVGDIGTHAWNLATFVSGLETDSLAADLDSFVDGRRVDDNVNVLLRFKPEAKGKPAKGMLWSSQVAPGNENGLKLRIYGDAGGIEWRQEDPNLLWYTPFGKPKQMLTRAGAGSNAAAARVTRVPAGHPEGYLEGFANIYSEAATAIRARRKKNGKIPKDVHFPTVRDGVDGMRFIDACVRSSAQNSAWIKL